MTSPLTLTWHDGTPVATDDADWAALAPTFLGCGFRLTVPLVPGTDAPVAFAHDAAARVAAVLGAALDEAPWAHVRGLRGPGCVEVVGGWAYGLDRRLGAPWTRVGPVAPARPDRAAYAVSLGWALGSGSPTAGLPMLSGLEDDRARAALEPGTVGLWWDVAGELATSTAGPLLLCAGDGWLVPHPRSGGVPSWVHTTLADRLGAETRVVTDATNLTADLTADLTAAVAVAPDGRLTRLRTLDGHALGADDDGAAVGLLTALRDAVVLAS
ncbi:MAG: hypothetical protein ACXVEJ_07140 [Nocardioides sp.]